jgi:hypothetical protein
MIEEIERFELYYDPSHDDPKEDPVDLERRLEELAESGEITLSVTDTTNYSTEERQQQLHSLRKELPSERGYTISRRTFMGDVFAGLRPVLVIRYEDTPPVVYPHRNDTDGNLPIQITDVLDTLDPAKTAERSDYNRVRTDREAEETTESKPDIEQPTGESETSVFSKIRQALPVHGLQ